MELTVQHANNEQVLRVLYSSLVLVCKVFYSLNFQDLPEFFEDSMQIWMGSFHKLLIGEVKCLQTGVIIKKLNFFLMILIYFIRRRTKMLV